MSDREIITLRLRDRSQHAAALPQAVRLRRLLKDALRKYGFRLVSVQVSGDAEHGAPGRQTKGAA